MNDSQSPTTGGWVRAGNLRPFFESLSVLVRYKFDDDDWQAIERSLPSTDSESDEAWYTYPLGGARAQVEVSVAQAVGADVVSFIVRGYDVADDLPAQLDAITFVFSQYSVIGESPNIQP